MCFGVGGFGFGCLLLRFCLGMRGSLLGCIMLRLVFVVCGRVVCLDCVVWWVACVLLGLVAFGVGAGLAWCLWLHLRWVVGFLISCCVYCECGMHWFCLMACCTDCVWFMLLGRLWLFAMVIWRCVFVGWSVCVSDLF